MSQSVPTANSTAENDGGTHNDSVHPDGVTRVDADDGAHSYDVSGSGVMYARARVPLVPSAASPRVAPPPSVPKYKSLDGEQHEDYSSYLRSTFIPGTSRRRLGNRPHPLRPPSGCSKRLYGEPRYGSPEERGRALAKQMEELQQQYDETHAEKSKRLNAKQQNENAVRLHDTEMHVRKQRHETALRSLEEKERKENEMDSKGQKRIVKLTQDQQTDLGKRLAVEPKRNQFLSSTRPKAKKPIPSAQSDGDKTGAKGEKSPQDAKTTAALEALNERLFLNPMKDHKKWAEKVKQEEAKRLEDAKLNKKKLTKAEMGESLGRLHNARCQKKEETKSRLYDKYVFSTDPPKKTLTKQQIADTVARMGGKS